jgi:hypothetical protein
LREQAAVVGLQFGVAQGQDLDLVGIERRGGLEVSYLLGVPPPLLLAGLVQFPRSLAELFDLGTGCLVGGQERLDHCGDRGAVGGGPGHPGFSAQIW